MALPSAGVLFEPVTCIPDWVARYAALPNTTVTSGCLVNSQGNVPCDPAAMARAASAAVGRTVSLEAYTLARYITSEVGTRSVPERVAVAQAAVNRVKYTERLGSVLNLLLYRQPVGHANRGYYGPIHGTELSAPYKRWAATSRDPALSNIIIAIDVLNGTIPVGFSRGADDQYGPEILVRTQGLETTQNGVRRRGGERRYWVGPLPGVDHQRTFLYTTRKDIDPTSELGRALIARSVAAIAAPRPNWTGLSTCRAAWTDRIRTGGFGTIGLVAGAALLAVGGIAFAKAWRGGRRPFGLAGHRPYASGREVTQRIAEMKEDDEEDRQRATAARVNEAAAKYGRRAFIADVARDVGVPSARLARLLVPWQRLGWVELDRLDIRRGVDPKVVEESEVEGPAGTYHLIVAPSGR